MKKDILYQVRIPSIFDAYKSSCNMLYYTYKRINDFLCLCNTLYVIYKGQIKSMFCKLNVKYAYSLPTAFCYEHVAFFSFLLCQIQL
jgi:hypothetical protein